MVDRSILRERGALLLIDMQNDVVKRQAEDGTYLLHEDRADFVRNCQDLVGWARSEDIPVFWVKVNRRADGADSPRSPLRDSGRPRASLVEGTPGNEVIDELDPRDEEFVVVKRRIGAFHGTPLDLQLRSLGRDILVIGGIATNWGVESTVRSAWDHDYGTVVVEDACKAFSDEEHEHAVRRILGARGDVLTCQELISST